MISKNTLKQCFVYITLPGRTNPVTAARFELSNPLANPIGRFVYGKAYLAMPDAVEFDPIELQLGAKIQPTTKLNGVYGALRDASPDYWGRLIIERAKGVAKLDEMDYLLESSDARAGALSFGHNNAPPAPNRAFNTILDLEELQEIALAIIEDKEKLASAKAEQAHRLLLVGTAMGGARPKAVVEDDQGLWIAKFNRPDDRWDSAKVEHMMLQLAKACGITVAHSRLTTIGNRNVLLVKRFDREKVENGYLRARMVSALTLLRSEDTVEAKRRGEWSYLALAEALRRISSDPKRDAGELFRRMCFNAAASNIDDHARNHAVIALDRAWELSPAYDLTPSPSIGMERFLQMTAGDQGTRASAENLLSQAGRFLLQHDEAKAVVNEVAQCVRSQWFRIARKEQVAQKDCETIRSAFENDGFFFQLHGAPPENVPAARSRKPPKS